MAATKVKVKLLPHRAVFVDGKLAEAGETVSVPGAEAKTLIAEGYAEKAPRGR